MGRNNLDANRAKTGGARRVLTFPAVAALWIAIGHPAAALDISVTEADLLEEELIEEPIVEKAGKWELKPVLEFGADYTDNVFATSEKQSDGVFVTSTGAEVTGDFEGLELRVNGSVDTYIPIETETERYISGSGLVGATVDLGEGIEFDLDAIYDDYSSARGTDEFEREQNLELQPTLTVSVGDNQIILRGSVGRLRYPGYSAGDDLLETPDDADTDIGLDDDDSDEEDDEAELAEGDSLSAADEDVVLQTDLRQHTFAAATIAYEHKVSDALTVYAGGLARLARFDERFTEEEIEQGSNGYGGFVGLKGSLSEKLAGDLALGVTRQHFRGAGNEDETFVTVDGYLQYKHDDRTRFTLSASTGYSDVDDDRAGAVLTYNASLLAERLVLEKTLLLAEASYSDDQFFQSDVRDKTLDLSAGIKHVFADHLIGTLLYTHTFATSNDPLDDYDANTVSVRLTLK